MKLKEGMKTCKKCYSVYSEKKSDKCPDCASRVKLPFSTGSFYKVKQFFYGDDRLMLEYKTSKGRYLLVKVVGEVEKEFEMNETNLKPFLKTKE